MHDGRVILCYCAAQPEILPDILDFVHEYGFGRFAVPAAVATCADEKACTSIDDWEYAVFVNETWKAGGWCTHAFVR